MVIRDAGAPSFRTSSRLVPGASPTRSWTVASRGGGGGGRIEAISAKGLGAGGRAGLVTAAWTAGGGGSGTEFGTTRRLVGAMPAIGIGSDPFSDLDAALVGGLIA